jgi:hypothetical protein
MRCGARRKYSGINALGWTHWGIIGVERIYLPFKYEALKTRDRVVPRDPKKHIEKGKE